MTSKKQNTEAALPGAAVQQAAEGAPSRSLLAAARSLGHGEKTDALEREMALSQDRGDSLLSKSAVISASFTADGTNYLKGKKEGRPSAGSTVGRASTAVGGSISDGTTSVGRPSAPFGSDIQRSLWEGSPNGRPSM